MYCVCVRMHLYVYVDACAFMCVACRHTHITIQRNTMLQSYIHVPYYRWRHTSILQTHTYDICKTYLHIRLRRKPFPTYVHAYKH
jgi:hypothetical protein